VCTICYMVKRLKKPETMTDTLRRVIEESQMSFKALERETGVTRQSMMSFVRGERSLRLDIADKLVTYFELELQPTKKRKAK